MSNDRQRKHAQAFKALHQARPGFIMPNAWDAGSAVILAQQGFKAIATTSAGVAFSLGKQDYQVSAARFAVTREEMFARMGEIARAVNIPVNGDLEAGYGDRPEAVTETVSMAIAAGLAGGNIEDKIPSENRLYDESLAIERIRAARATIDAQRNGFVLTARTDAFQFGGAAALGVVIRRGRAFLEAGADCVFPPGVTDLAMIATIAKEIGGPLNIVAGLGTAAGNTHAMIEAGAQRISLGGSIARAVLGFVRQAGRELRDEGTLRFAESQIPQPELNALFARGAYEESAAPPVICAAETAPAENDPESAEQV
jgi:2-methylisocitrate lyase-like PEP mutase family enzyme